MNSNSRIIDSYGRTSLKISERIDLFFPESNALINFFISHWPSRLHHQESDPKRLELATTFRKYLDSIREIDSLNKHIILMGDYNDDPFSPSLYKHLLATRDRQLATENDNYLYNPFWRNLGESDYLVHEDSNKNSCGTYYYSQGNESKWFNFDQIIFSSAFLKNGLLRLNEENCIILRNEDLVSRIKSLKYKFDHLPVLGVIDIGEIV